MTINRPIRRIIARESNVWTAVYNLRSYEFDAGGRLSAIALCNAMQDAASGHAENLGVSVHRLLSQGRTWVLSRLALAVERLPGTRQRIRVKTWPSGGSGLFALRDFWIEGEDGAVIAAGVSAWLMIDTATRRPLRIAPWLDKLRPVTIGHVLPNDLAKLPAGEGLDHRLRLQVRYRDLDINQHVNNVSYIEWVLEALPLRVRQNASLTGLEINFLREAVAGDAVLSGCRPCPDRPGVYVHGLLAAQSGNELVRAQTTWRPKRPHR